MRWWCRWIVRSWTPGSSPSKPPLFPRPSATPLLLPPPTITTATTPPSEAATIPTPAERRLHGNPYLPEDRRPSITSARGAGSEVSEGEQMRGGLEEKGEGSGKQEGEGNGRLKKWNGEEDLIRESRRVVGGKSVRELWRTSVLIETNDEQLSYGATMLKRCPNNSKQMCLFYWRLNILIDQWVIPTLQTCSVFILKKSNKFEGEKNIKTKQTLKGYAITHII